MSARAMLVIEIKRKRAYVNVFYVHVSTSNNVLSRSKFLEEGYDR